MTQFLPSMIPATIQTTEQLVVWASEIHSYLYGAVTSIETLDYQGNPQDTRVIQTSSLYLTAPTPNCWRYISRHSLLLVPEFLTGTAVWNNVQPLGNTAIPASMRAS